MTPLTSVTTGELQHLLAWYQLWYQEFMMPALNIRFTEAELAALRRRAQTEGRPVTRLAHDVLVESANRANHDAVVMEAAAEVISLSRILLEKLADR